VSKAKRKVLVVVMDGVGTRDSTYGNAFKLATTPQLDLLARNGLYRTIKAHGTYVGLPSDADMGNSEVGHNALGAGRVFDQGAKLVQNAIDSKRLYEGETWRDVMGQISKEQSTLHFLGLLSDGNVHSHEQHLYSLLRQAVKDGAKKIRVHALLDGRDVSEKSAEIYIERLEQVMGEIRSLGCDIAAASGGGRMTTTMDRYGADWKMVERGWYAHVLGEADLRFPSLTAAIQHFREDKDLSDQYIPSFVIDESGRKFEGMKDGDAVIFFNFRGDRSIEISRAFEEIELEEFDRKRLPKVLYAGMMEYDGDLHIPNRYLVSPPAIDDTLSEHLVHNGLRQFACSETQKYGHVTFFWNGNRSGKFDERLEEYLEIPSDNIAFDLKPWMKAHEITDATIARMMSNSFDFARINYPNGDMVGHTGNLEASIVAVSTIDLCVGRLLKAAELSNTILIFTADHGNCDEMFDTNKEGPANWFELPFNTRPKPKTSHTLNPVPFYLYDPKGMNQYRLRTDLKDGSIANIPGTALALLGLREKDSYLPSLVELI
jgi:2,3-bisphosphoglycerate-independent phosphoglycerate mutase